MVAVHDEQVLFLVQADEHGAQQRPRAEIERRARLLLRQRGRFLAPLRGRQVLQADAAQRHGRRRQDVLLRADVVGDDGRAQHFMAAHDFIEAALQDGAVGPAAHPHGRRHVVGG